MPATFDALSVPPKVLAALAAMGYHETTPVQEQALPPLLAGRDALVEAETGSGKTAAFGIPVVVAGSRAPGLRALVLVPTRELARQVADEIREIGAGSPFRAVAVTGGVHAEKEERAIAGDVRCIVATPGRLIALLEKERVRLDRLELLVVDEADRMLDMGFAPDLERVLAAASARKQTALVSATLPDEVVRLASKHLRDPVHIRASPRAMPASLTHQRLNVFEGKKDQALVAVLQIEKPDRAIVFVRTRNKAARVAKLLKDVAIPADQLQGEMSHEQRRHVFDLFSRGITKVLVATDLASRGLDVPEMQLVVNYDLPDEPGAYTHRGGRAARLGREGRIVTFVLPEEKPLRQRLERESGGEWAPYKLSPQQIDAVVLPDPKALRAARVAKAAKTARAPPRAPGAPRVPRAPPAREAPGARPPKHVRRAERAGPAPHAPKPKAAKGARTDAVPESRKGRARRE